MFYAECEFCGVVQDETPEVESALLAANIHHKANRGEHPVKVWSLIKVLGALVLALMTSQAHASENWYEYGDVLIGSEPVLVDSTNDGTPVFIQVPDYGPGVVVGELTLTTCKKWEDYGRPDWAALPKPVIDKYITKVATRANYLTGLYSYVIGDLSPTPRQQWICPRLPFVRTDRGD